MITEAVRAAQCLYSMSMVSAVFVLQRTDRLCTFVKLLLQCITGAETAGAACTQP
jgi:hypothetical protein